MDEDDSLQITSDPEVKSILECLKPDFPLSIHAYYFIDSLVKWKKKVPSADIGILTPKGGYKSGAVFFYVIGFNHLVFSAYAWTKDGLEALKNSLLSTKRFHWKDYKYVLVTCLTDEVWNVLGSVLPDLLKDRQTHISHDKVFWLPKEEVVKFDIKAPEGTYLGELKKEHAEMINNVWPHRSEGSKELMELMMWVNFGRGLFNSNDQLVAWAFYWFFGALGVVQTAESERRKGYGKVVVQAVCKEMGSQGLDVNLNIVEGNVVSEAFFRSQGFRHAFDSIWVFSAINNE